MHPFPLLAIQRALFAILALAVAMSAATAPRPQGDERNRFAGRWLYVEDRTEGRPVAERQPPMSVTFGFRVDDDAVVMLRGEGDNVREEPIPLDGSTREEEKGASVSKMTGRWQDGVLQYDVEMVREDGSRIAHIRRRFRLLPDGLQIEVTLNPPEGATQVAFYQHPKDIRLPAPATARIADMAWLADAWVGKRRDASIEERWGPPLGGAMLGVSRTVAGGRMRAFEFLRIVERDGGLVYVAQPGGKAATEFVLTELKGKRAVFDNPRHDFPQRIVYELGEDGGLTAAIGFVRGGSPRRFEFSREGR